MSSRTKVLAGFLILIVACVAGSYVYEYQKQWKRARITAEASRAREAVADETKAQIVSEMRQLEAVLRSGDIGRTKREFFGRYGQDDAFKDSQWRFFASEVKDYTYDYVDISLTSGDWYEKYWDSAIVTIAATNRRYNLTKYCKVPLTWNSNEGWRIQWYEIDVFPFFGCE